MTTSSGDCVSGRRRFSRALLRVGEEDPEQREADRDLGVPKRTDADEVVEENVLSPLWIVSRTSGPARISTSSSSAVRQS